MKGGQPIRGTPSDPILSGTSYGVKMAILGKNDNWPEFFEIMGRDGPILMKISENDLPSKIWRLDAFDLIWPRMTFKRSFGIFDPKTPEPPEKQ